MASVLTGSALLFTSFQVAKKLLPAAFDFAKNTSAFIGPFSSVVFKEAKHSVESFNKQNPEAPKFGGRTLDTQVMLSALSSQKAIDTAGVEPISFAR